MKILLSLIFFSFNTYETLGETLDCVISQDPFGTKALRAYDSVSLLKSIENQNNQLIQWGKKSIKSVVWQKCLFNSVQMFYQVAPGRPAWVFKKITLAASYESQLCCICEMLSLSKATAFIWSITVIKADCSPIRMDTVIHISQKLSNEQVDYTCIARNFWMTTMPSEKAMAPYSNTLAWKIPWTEEPGGLQSMGSLRVGRDWATSLSLFTFMHWRRKWQPTPVFLPGESQGRGSLMGCRLWGHTGSDVTEAT